MPFDPSYTLPAVTIMTELFVWTSRYYVAVVPRLSNWHSTRRAALRRTTRRESATAC